MGREAPLAPIALVAPGLSGDAGMGMAESMDVALAATALRYIMGTATEETMRDSCYLVFDRRGVRKMTKTAPDLSSGQYAVKVNVGVPDGLFDRTFPEVDIEVPEQAVIAPEVAVEFDEEVDEGEW